MATFDRFDVVVVPFPFTHRSTGKRRPALVLSGSAFNQDTGHIVLSMITTARRSAWASDVPLTDWTAAGLPHPSVVRAKLFTLDSRFVLRKLNTLTTRDRNAVRRSLAAVLEAPHE